MIMRKPEYDVFISYSSKNRAMTEEIVRNLEQSGISCWYAPRNIKPGEVWEHSIVTAIRSSWMLLLIYTDESNASAQVENELAVAANAGSLMGAYREKLIVPSEGMSNYFNRMEWINARAESVCERMRILTEGVLALLAKSNSTPYMEIDEHTYMENLVAAKRFHENQIEEIRKKISIIENRLGISETEEVPFVAALGKELARCSLPDDSQLFLPGHPKFQGCLKNAVSKYAAVGENETVYLLYSEFMSGGAKGFLMTESCFYGSFTWAVDNLYSSRLPKKIPISMIECFYLDRDGKISIRYTDEYRQRIERSIANPVESGKALYVDFLNGFLKVWQWYYGNREA